MKLKSSILTFMLAAVPAVATAQGTDIIRKPASWRGTLLEGTDALIATNNFGEPLFIQSGETIGTAFAPAPLTGAELAAEFKKLCLDSNFDQAALAAAATSSRLSLSAKTVTVAPLTKGEAFTATLWTGPAARVQIWSGNTTSLNGRQTLSRWRNGATSSPFRASNVAAPSCGVTVMTTNFHDPAGFIAAISTELGIQPGKAVTKSPWADGFWSIANGDGSHTRVTYSMTDLDRSEQLLHVAVTRQTGIR